MASVPPRTGSSEDDARLPWVARTPPGPAISVDAGRGGSGLRWFISLLILALVSAGAFVLGRGSETAPDSRSQVDATPSRVPAVKSMSQPVAPSTPTGEGEANGLTPPALARVAEAPKAAEAETIDIVAVPAPPSRPLHLNTQQISAVRKIVRDAKVNVRRVDRPVHSLLPSAAPPGRVVQLGAYRSASEANAAARVFRYKYRGLLATLPTAVLPFRPTGANKLFYRVQFVTPSQAYSEVTCQRLRAAAKTCTVVY